MSALLKAAEAVVAARFSPNQSWDALKDSIAELADAIHQTGEEAASAPKDDGGPAFPQTEKLMNSGFPDFRVREVTGGMSLRDWFAGMALQPILTAACQGHLSRISSGDPLGPKDYAVSAYANADAMLLARKEAQP